MITPNTHLDPELLSAYLDDEVTNDERQLIAAHLPTCATCQKELESMRFTVALVAALPPRPVPRPFYITEAMVAPTPAKSQQTAGWFGWWRGLAPFGAAIAALLVVLVLVRPLFMGGGAAMPVTTTQSDPAEAGIALAPTEEMMEVETSGAMESAPTDSAADTADDSATELPSAENAETRLAEATEVMEPALAPESAAGNEQAATPESGAAYSTTAPLVGADSATTTMATDTTAAPPAAAPPRQDNQISPFTMNTILIITLILVLVMVGSLAIFVRRRQP